MSITEERLTTSITFNQDQAAGGLTTVIKNGLRSISQNSSFTLQLNTAEEADPESVRQLYTILDGKEPAGEIKITVKNSPAKDNRSSHESDTSYGEVELTFRLLLNDSGEPTLTAVSACSMIYGSTVQYFKMSLEIPPAN